MADSVDDVLGMTPPPLGTHIKLRGVIKHSDTQEEVLFALGGCKDEWMPLRKNDILHVRFFRHKLCRKPGEEPHYHPAVKLTLPSNVENAPFLSVLSTLQGRMLRASRELRRLHPMSGEGSCGAPCNDVSLGFFACAPCRPEYDEDGNCECDPDNCPGADSDGNNCANDG